MKTEKEEKENLEIEERDGSLQVVGLRLEVRVENGNELAVFDVAPFQAFSQSSCFVPNSVLSDLVPYVETLNVEVGVHILAQTDRLSIEVFWWCDNPHSFSSAAQPCSVRTQYSFFFQTQKLVQRDL